MHNCKTDVPACICSSHSANIHIWNEHLLKSVFRRGMTFIHSLWINTVVFVSLIAHILWTVCVRARFFFCTKKQGLLPVSRAKKLLSVKISPTLRMFIELDTHQRLGISITEHHFLPKLAITDVSFPNTELNSPWHPNFHHGNALLQA